MADAATKSREQQVAGLGAVELRDRIAAGALKAIDAAEGLIARIEATEPKLQAWTWFDAEDVRAQATALDTRRRMGQPIGPLHGVPVGIKDVIDTARIPTGNGTPIDAGRVPSRDAWVVAQLRAAGAVVMGKTVTTELAYLHPGPARNPFNPEHTPGGSSSGSAAAVGAGQVPLAIGTQTGGSVIRPAAFCGTVGFKPSFGAIPRTGVLTQSPTLDTMGVFARSVPDAALIAEVLFGHDPADRATAPTPRPRLLETALSRPPLPPIFAFVRPPGWEDAAPETREALEELVAALGDQCFEAPLPNAFDEAAAIRERINFAEMAKNYYTYERRGWDQLSEVTRAAIEQGRATLARDYLAALDWGDVLYAGLAELFERCDAILAPAAPGPAPHGLDSTGSAIFNGLWTLVGTPAVTVPVFVTEAGLPMGAQVIGRRGDDGRLLRSANWLMNRVLDPQPQGTP